MSFIPSHRIHTRTLFSDPLNTLGLSEESPSSWVGASVDQQRVVLLQDLNYIEEGLLGRDVVLDYGPWGNLLKNNQLFLNLFPAGQRLRKQSKTQQAMFEYGPDLFFERWFQWVVYEMRILFEEKEAATGTPKQDQYDLYSALRLASLRVVARTVCASFRGDVIDQIASSLEILDDSFARLFYGGKGKRPAWLPGSDHKKASTAFKEVQDLIRPLIRSRIAGQQLEDDLLSRWVQLEGPDGRHLNESQVIDEALAFLLMGYTSLPKMLFGAIYEVTPQRQPETIERLNREFGGIVQALTPTPEELAIRTPVPSTPKTDKAWNSIPLHCALCNESLRLYPPSWVIPYRSTHDADIQDLKVKENDHFWMNVVALHTHQRRFKNPERFWPQRWAGQLEAQLPKYAYAPFGLEGKPTLSELFCRELGPRFLMVWFSKFRVIHSPEKLNWSLSLCLRPTEKLEWGLKES